MSGGSERNFDGTDWFAALRPRLIRIAHRMTGSHADAEDIVQDAWLRSAVTDWSTIHSREAWLVTIVSRLALDFLKSARFRRESYVGMWLPEPVMTQEAVAGDEVASDAVDWALMAALERLSPLERAAFLLHDVFAVDFAEIARILERDAAACRQLAKRARDHVRTEKPRFPLSQQQERDIAEAFFQASRSGDISALQSLLAEDVVLYSDGGGIRNAAINTVYGRERLIRFYVGISRKRSFVPPAIRRFGFFDRLPGHLSLEDDGMPQIAALAIANGRIAAIYLLRNPEKLQSFALPQLPA